MMANVIKIINKLQCKLWYLDYSKEHDKITENKIFVCGHLSVSIRTLMGGEKLNERGIKSWVQKEDLKWLLATRKEYIRCYYLHLAVDNIYENKDRIKVGKETVENCIDSWGKNRAVVVPGTEPYLKIYWDF